MRYAARKIFSKLWLTATLLLLGLTVIAPPTAVPGERVLPEYHLQAAYIVNFIRFTTWPESVFTDKDKDIVLGILGEDRFGSVLDIIDGENIKNRRLQVLRLGSGGDPHGCHILYISDSEHRHLRQILASLKGTSTMTVSDMDNFAEEGGMIQIKKIDNKVKIFINIAATREAGLQLRANLLSIATLINQ